MTTEKNSETFFKVFYDCIKLAQQEIKAKVSVNTRDSKSRDNSTGSKNELKKKSKDEAKKNSEDNM